MALRIGDPSKDQAEDSTSSPVAPQLARKRTTYGKQISRLTSRGHPPHQPVHHTPDQRSSEDSKHSHGTSKSPAAARTRDTFDVPSSEDEISRPITTKSGSVKRSRVESESSAVSSSDRKISGLQRPKKLVKATTNGTQPRVGSAIGDVFKSDGGNVKQRTSSGRSQPAQSNSSRNIDRKILHNTSLLNTPDKSSRPTQGDTEPKRLSLELSEGVHWQPTAIGRNTYTGMQHKTGARPQAMQTPQMVQSVDAHPLRRAPKPGQDSRMNVKKGKGTRLPSTYPRSVPSMSPSTPERPSPSGAVAAQRRYHELGHVKLTGVDANQRVSPEKPVPDGSRLGNDLSRGFSEGAEDMALQSTPEISRRRKLKDRLIPTTRASIQSVSSGDDEQYDELTEDSQNATSEGEREGDDDQLCSPPAHELYPGTTPTNLSQTPGKGKVTYGRQRSHLAEQAADVDSVWEDPLVEMIDSSATPRRKLGNPVQNREENLQRVESLSGSEDEAQENALRSIHELRAAGKMRRAALETDALLDDIGTASTMSLKRSSIFRLAGKLLDNDYRDAFVRNGLHVRFYTVLGSNTDHFFVVAFCMAALRLFDIIPAFDLAPGKAANSLLDAAVLAVQQDQPLLSAAKARSANMSRMHQQDLQRLLSAYIDHSKEFSGDVGSLTARIFGLQCLERSIRHLRQSGYSGPVVSPTVVSTLSDVAAQPFDESAAALMGEQSQKLALSTLEGLSTGQLTSKENDGGLSQSVIDNILTAAVVRIRRDQELPLPGSNVALRLCLNLTTDSRQNCQLLANETIITEVTALIQSNFDRVVLNTQDSDQDALIDNLVLSLGFLTNLTEKSIGIHGIFLGSSVNGSTCVQALTQIFQRCWEGASAATTESESKINVTFGYLTVLLCSLCINSEIRSKAATILEDQSLGKIRAAMAQFILFHRTILQPGDNEPATESHSQAVFVGRMEELLRVLTSQTQ